MSSATIFHLSLGSQIWGTTDLKRCRLHFTVTEPRWTLQLPKRSRETGGNIISSCLVWKYIQALSLIWSHSEKKCQRCISWHPQRILFTKSFDCSRSSVCVLSLCQMAKYSLTLTAKPSFFLHPLPLIVTSHQRGKSCNYCTWITVETTSQQSSFGHRWADGVTSGALKLEALVAPWHLLNDGFMSLCESRAWIFSYKCAYGAVNPESVASCWCLKKPKLPPSELRSSFNCDVIHFSGLWSYTNRVGVHTLLWKFLVVKSHSNSISSNRY